MFGATVAAGLTAGTDLDVGSQQVSCGTAASASSRPSFAGNRADGRPSLCSSEFAGGFRVAGGRVRSTKNLLVVLMSMIKRALAR